MKFEHERIEHRPLVSRAGFVALIAGVVLMLCLLLPAAMRRQSLALEVLPDALSLIYLELNLARRPADGELRIQVAQRMLQAGQLETARATLSPLLAAGSPLSPRAAQLKVAIDRQAWAAIHPLLREARTQALERLIASIDAIDLSGAPADAVRRTAKLYDSLAQPARAAEVLDALARRRLPEFESHVTAAETAHRGANQTGRAVELHVWLAETLDGKPAVDHALRALALAPAVSKPVEVLALAERLRARLGPNDPQLLAASLTLAESANVKLAFQLADRLLRLQPGDAALHRKIARLAEWNGNTLRALDEYVWLTRHSGRADDRARAIELARANWDLRLLRELLRPTPAPAPAKRRLASGRSAVRDGHTAIRTRRTARACGPNTRAGRRDAKRVHLRETLGLYEALGDTDAAVELASAAVRGELGDDPDTLELQVALLQRAGRPDAAADALTLLAQRFPSQARARALAQLRLSLDQPREALDALQNGPEPYSESYLRELLELAWELGELPLAASYAERVVKLPAATAWDVARLWQLQREHLDPQVPLATAIAGFERFRNAESFRLVLASAQRLNDDDRVSGLLQQAEHLNGFRGDPTYWQQRITLHHRLAFAAFERKEFMAAKRELSEAEKVLERAPAMAPSDSRLYEELWTSQYAQVLSVALEAGDRAALALAFDRYGENLPVRQRVYVLHRLDRHAEAFALARIGAADPRLSDSDRAALAADRPSETATVDGSPDYARAGSELLHTDGLRVWTHHAALAVDSEALGLSLETAWSDIAARSSLRALQPEAAREISAGVTGRAWGTELTVGGRMRDEDAPIPYGGFRQRLFGDRDEGLTASLMLQEQTADSSQLRLLGATDEAALQSAITFGSGYYATARAAANRYLTRERDYLGAGATVDLGVGRSLALDDFGRVAMRVTGRFAPRFRDADEAAREDARQPERWIPETSGFSGIGATLAHGELAIPQPNDPAFRFLLDGSIGVLWPARKLGWSGQAGLGSALFGADQLSAELRAGNVVGAEMFWNVSAGYAVGFE